ncbi:MAG: type II secretion system F family protein [Nanoarchaeota archaeon]|nr:type II secretion system F family protein [Nanoarchaeota archaeon]
MANNIISLKNLGKLLMPNKILSLQYSDKIKVAYERVNGEKIRYEIMFYFYISSFFLSLIISFYLLDYVYFFLENFMNSTLYQVGIFTLYFSIIQISVYYGILIGYLIKFDSKITQYEINVEKDLPDFLDNLISNLKGGLILEKALMRSVRDDQKELLHEVTLINEKILSGTSVEKALSEMRERFNSQIISRTLFLIIEGLKGGGNLSAPLERISNNLKKLYLLDSEVKSSVGGFTVVIKAIGGFLAPALFALAITLLVFIGDLLVLLSSSGTNVIAMSELPENFVFYLVTFSYSMIVLVSIFSNLITSQLKNEEGYKALKSIPITIILSSFLYYYLSDILIAYFSNII